MDYIVFENSLLHPRRRTARQQQVEGLGAKFAKRVDQVGLASMVHAPVWVRCGFILTSHHCNPLGASMAILVRAGTRGSRRTWLGWLNRDRVEVCSRTRVPHGLLRGRHKGGQRGEVRRADLSIVNGHFSLVIEADRRQ